MLPRSPPGVKRFCLPFRRSDAVVRPCSLPLPRGKGYARLRRHIVPQPLAPLLSFLNAHPGVCCLAVTGAGGKTSLIADLTDIFAASGRSCVIAPTTRIFVPPLRNRAPGTRPQENEHSPRPCDALLLRNGRPPDALAEELLALLRDPRRHGAPVCAALGEDIKQSPAGRKLRGLPPGYVCRLKTLLERAFPPDSAPSPLLLAEADGAARRPLKAHAAHEPVIPACADAVAAVMGLDALGKTLAEAVHRPEIAADLLGAEPDSPVTPAMAAALLLHPAGPFRGAPPDAARLILLNRADALDPARRGSLIRNMTETLRASGGPENILVRGKTGGRGTRSGMPHARS